MKIIKWVGDLGIKIKKLYRILFGKGLKISYISSEEDEVYIFFKEDIKKCQLRHSKYKGDEQVFVCLIKHDDPNNILPKKISNKYELSIFFTDYYDKGRIKLAKEYLFKFTGIDGLNKIANSINEFVNNRYK